MEQAIVSGLTQGAAYALVAVGLALVYSVSRTINLAHGAFVVLGIMLVQALAGPLGLVARSSSPSRWVRRRLPAWRSSRSGASPTPRRCRASC